PAAAARLVTGLEILARARNLLAIEGEPEGEPLRAALLVDLLRRRGDGPYLPAISADGRDGTDTGPPTGEAVYHEGDRLALRVTHQAGRPLYLHVFDVGLAGAVHQLYPIRGASDPLLPGQLFEIGTTPGQTLTVRIPAELDAQARAAGREHRESREVLKIFVTTDEADLSGWEQESRRGSPAGSLASLLRLALGGPATRDTPPAPTPGSLWTVVTRTFLVRRAPEPDRR
ncbi:MAG: DUF4384 domain-containing protein, partial [Acidobacteriota bacterium]|nr:DUF4384 domain-containing protein [Acidobacteriota bacterium]